MQSQTIPILYCRSCDSISTDLSAPNCPRCAGVLCDLLVTLRPCRLAAAARWVLRAAPVALAVWAVLAAAFIAAVAL